MTERDRIIRSLSADELLLFVGLGGKPKGASAVMVLDALAREFSLGASSERFTERDRERAERKKPAA